MKTAFDALSILVYAVVLVCGIAIGWRSAERERVVPQPFNILIQYADTIHMEPSACIDMFGIPRASK